jgi:hypothetical protein
MIVLLQYAAAQTTQKSVIKMSLSPLNSNWRGDINEYYRLVNVGLQELLADAHMMGNLEKLWPGMDIKKSLERSGLQMWGIEKGFLFKKKSNVKRINMKQTFFDTIQYSRVEKSPFASQPKENRDAKPVITEAEERRNYKVSSMILSIVAAIMRLSDTQLREQKSYEFNNQLQVAVAQGTAEGFVENYYEDFSAEHPEVFFVKKETPTEPVHIAAAMDDEEFQRRKQLQMQKIHQRIGA